MLFNSGFNGDGIDEKSFPRRWTIDSVCYPMKNNEDLQVASLRELTFLMSCSSTGATSLALK